MGKSKESDGGKKVVRVADGPAEPGFGRALADTMGMCFRPLIPLTILIVVYAGISYLLWRPLNGESGVTESSEQALLTEKSFVAALKMNPCPAWMPPKDYKQLAIESITAGKGRSVFEAGLSRKLASAYAQNSWVENVRQIRLRYPARMELEIEFRKPFAKLDHGAVLDRQGFVLNLPSDSSPARNLPTLRGVTARNPAVGAQLLDKPARQSLDLLAVVRRVLAASPGNLRADSVEQRDGMWRITTAGGPLIMWGTYTDDPPIDEPRTLEKAELLRKRLNEWNPTTLEYVKVYIAQAPIKLKTNTSTQEISTPIGTGPRPQ